MGLMAAQHRPKVVHAGEGMQLNVQGIRFTYKATKEETGGLYAFTDGVVPPNMAHRCTFIIGTTRHSTFSKVSSRSNAMVRFFEWVRARSPCCRRVSRTDFRTCPRYRARFFAFSLLVEWKNSLRT